MYLHLLKTANSFVVTLGPRITPSNLAITRRDDCMFIKFPNRMILTIGYTSSGGIGPKQMDKVKTDSFTLGKMMARVALMDVLSTGSWPIAIIATLSVEMSPTGFNITRGIKSEMRKIDLDPQILCVNTEENISVEQTGLGITVVGLGLEGDLRVGTTQIGDVIIAVGEPHVGEEVIEAERYHRIADLRDVIQFLQTKRVHEIIPVDTMGILHKARFLAHSIGRQIRFYENIEFDLKKSAGPATSILISVDRDGINGVIKELKKPYALIGEIV